MKIEITTDMLVSDIIELAPDAPAVLDNSGVKVTGCDVRTDQPLQKMVNIYKLDDEAAEKLLIHLNKLSQSAAKYEPQPQDSKIEEIQEGNKTYFKIAGFVLTDSALKNLHQMASKKGLQIRLEAGGCSGFKYSYDYKDAPEEDEKTYPLSDDLALYLNDFTFDKSYGSVVEFSLGLHNSGLQIMNPNKKRACSCGISVAF
jgi:iron-sulfur cluster assembly accessory protein